jgi:hypothetical protein
MTYYQPEYDKKAWGKREFFSFMVYLSKKQAQENFPGLRIIEYQDEDIENPTFVDHECSWDTVDWGTISPEEFPKFEAPHYYIAGQGSMLYRDGLCRECGRKLIEKYLRVGVFFENSGDEAL